MGVTMAEWVAVAYGALDITGREDFDDSEILILPTIPSTPIGLTGVVAALWRQLVAAPVDDSSLTDDQFGLLREFEQAGIASRNLDHSARISILSKPWFVSPMHELVNSLVGSVARDAGISLIVIKGPIQKKQGLRKKDHSGDVDVWVDPEKIPHLVELLTAWGWTHQAGIWDGTAVNHSWTMSRGEWGCEIDLHEHFPGIGISSIEAFHVIEDHSETTSFASVQLRHPDKPSHVIIGALHALRPTWGREVSSATMEKVTDRLRESGEPAYEMAHRIGAMAALEDALRIAFPDREIPDPGPLPRNWVWRGKRNRLLGYISALNMLPWRQRTLFLWRFIWPTDDAVLESERQAGSAELNPTKARLNRLRRGVRGIRP